MTALAYDELDRVRKTHAGLIMSMAHAAERKLTADEKYDTLCVVLGLLSHLAKNSEGLGYKAGSFLWGVKELTSCAQSAAYDHRRKQGKEA